jgi:hypothetical protein
MWTHIQPTRQQQTVNQPTKNVLFKASTSTSATRY